MDVLSIDSNALAAEKTIVWTPTVDSVHDYRPADKSRLAYAICIFTGKNDKIPSLFLFAHPHPDTIPAWRRWVTDTMNPAKGGVCL